MALSEVVTSAGEYSSIIGALVTVWLVFEARKMRKSFLCKARLPQICDELRSEMSNLAKELADWEENSQGAHLSLSKIKGILQNLRKKLPSGEKKQAKILLRQFHPRDSLFKSREIPRLSKDECWQIYCDLNSFDSELRNLQKDAAWE